MSYTDKDNHFACELAYLDIDEEFVRNKDYTIKELIVNHPDKIKNLGKEKAKNPILAQEIKEIQNGNSKYCNWVIKDVRDENKETGFFALTIEPGQDDVFIAFRGSELDFENLDNPDDYLKLLRDGKDDWVYADAALAFQSETIQQKLAIEYTGYICNKYKNKDIIPAGHSLAGNLVTSAYLGNTKEVRDRIKKCIGIDSPKNFEPFYNDPRYQEAINENKQCNKLFFYNKSVVGEIGYNDIGAETVYIKTALPKNADNTFDRHLLSNDIFEGENFIIDDNPSLDDKKDGDLINKLAKKAYAEYIAEKENGVDGIATKIEDLVTVLELAISGVDISVDIYKYLSNYLSKCEKALDEYKDSTIENLSINLKGICCGSTISIDPDLMTSYAGELNRIIAKAKDVSSRINKLRYKSYAIAISPKLSWVKSTEPDIFSGNFYKLSRCQKYMDETAKDFKKVEESIANA